MAGLLEMLLAAHLGGRGAPGAFPGVPQGAVPEAGGMDLSGILGPMGMGGAPAAGFAALPQEGGERVPGSPAEEAEAARQAAALRLQRGTRRAGVFSTGAPAIPGIEAVAGLLTGGGSPAAPELPPSTNDPASAEPEVLKDGVPLPRPRPDNLGTPNESVASAPLSMSPDANVAAIPPNAAPVAGPVPAGMAPPPAEGGGMGSLLGKIFNPRNAPLLLAMGNMAGAPSLGTGIRRASQAAIAPAMMMQKQGELDLGRAETYRALVAKGVSPHEAVAAMRNPELLKALIAKHFETKPAQIVNNRLVRENVDGTVRVLGDYSDDKTEPKLGEGYQWNNPKDKGSGQRFIPGGPADPKVKAQSARLANPPAYEWVDPEDHSKGQRAIEGGSATKVTPEVSARIGLARSFLDQLPSIRKRVEKGDVTGPWDAAMAKAGLGDPGEIRRQIDSGAEALLRNLTGAGMNQTEAANYVRRYQVSPLDTSGQLLSKMGQLERELGFVINEVEKGRSIRPGTRPGLKPGQSIDIDGVKIHRVD